MEGSGEGLVRKESAKEGAKDQTARTSQEGGKISWPVGGVETGDRGRYSQNVKWRLPSFNERCFCPTEELTFLAVCHISVFENFKCTFDEKLTF